MLNVGDVIEIKEGHQIYATVPKHFLYSNCKGNFELRHEHITVKGELSYFYGKYIVINTANEGSGEGKYSQAGYRVYCIAAEDKNRKIDFFQTGSFTAMIKDIEPIGKAKVQWDIED